MGVCREVRDYVANFLNDDLSIANRDVEDFQPSALISLIMKLENMTSRNAITDLYFSQPFLDDCNGKMYQYNWFNLTQFN